MRILVTGAKGFVGKNLCAQLNNIKDGKAKNYPVVVTEVMGYDLDTDPALLDTYCQKADFVFNLAGVNRPKDQTEFMEGNFGFASTLLDTLKRYKNTCPVMLSSSIQATLIGRYGASDYGKSKLAGEELFFAYAQKTGAKVLVYRFPNLFGKWCRPNYNSAVATFCNNIANDFPIQVNGDGNALRVNHSVHIIFDYAGSAIQLLCSCHNLVDILHDFVCIIFLSALNAFQTRNILEDDCIITECYYICCCRLLEFFSAAIWAHFGSSFQ